MDMDPQTLEQVHELYLLRKGYIVRTGAGRMATELASQHYGKSRSASRSRPNAFRPVEAVASPDN